MRKDLQRGFVHSRLLDLAFLFLLILVGIGVWQWLATLVSGDFMLAWFMVWLMAAAAAWWWTREQLRVLRLPAGFLVFLGLGLLAVPLSRWSGSKLVTLAEAAVLAVGAKHLGRRWEARLKPRLEPAAPWYLDQSIDLIADLGRWFLASVVTWFAVGVVPLVLAFVLPLDSVPWGALAWAFGATAWYLYDFRKARVRLLKLPVGLWAFIATAVILQLFQQQLAGSMDPGSIGLVAYTACWPAVAAVFVEAVVIGTKKPADLKV